MLAERQIEDDRALTDKDICTILGISKTTLKRYRQKHGLPAPSFRVGQMPYTWRSVLGTWLATKEAESVDASAVPHSKTYLALG